MAESEITVALKLVADPFKNGMKQAEDSLGSFLGVSGTMATALSAAAVGLAALAKSASSAAEDLLQLSQKTGIATQTMQEWSVAMGQNRIGPEEMATGIRGLAKAMGEAQAGTGRGAEAFKALGISATDAAGNLRDPDVVLLELADKFAGMKDGAGKADLAVDLFTRSGLRMIPFLNLGSKGIGELKEKSYELGAVLSGDTMQALGKMDNGFDNLGVALAALKLNLGGLMTPWNDFLNGVAGAIGIVNNFIQNPLKGLEIELVHLNVFLREAGLNVAYFMGGFLVTGGFDKLKAQIAAVEADGKRMIGQINAIFPREEKPKATGAEPPPRTVPLTGSGAKATLKTAEEQLKADLEDSKMLAKEREQLVQKQILAENLDERNAAIERAAIRQQDIDNQIASIRKIFPVLREVHEVELQAAGIVPEKRAAADEAYKAKVIKYTADIKKLSEERVIGQMETTNKVIDIDRKMYETIGKMDLDYDKQTTARNLQKIRDVEALAAAQVAIGNEQLLPPVEMAHREMTSIDAQMARLKADQTVTNWTETEAKLDVLRAQRQTKEEVAENSFLAGWARGMKTFTRDSTGAFGQAQVMARETAAKMESGFETLFFDAMNNKFHSLKDVATSVFTFMQQLAAKTLAQYATTQVLGGTGAAGEGVGLLPGLFNLFNRTTPGGVTGDINSLAAVLQDAPGHAGGGLVGQRYYFARGGPIGTDTVPIWATPGEGIVTVDGMKNLGAGGLSRINAGGGTGRPVIVNMTVNANDAGSFRKSQDQILMDVQRAMGRAQRNA